MNTYHLTPNKKDLHKSQPVFLNKKQWKIGLSSAGRHFKL